MENNIWDIESEPIVTLRFYGRNYHISAAMALPVRAKGEQIFRQFPRKHTMLHIVIAADVEKSDGWCLPNLLQNKVCRLGGYIDRIKQITRDQDGRNRLTHRKTHEPTEGSAQFTIALRGLFR